MIGIVTFFARQIKKSRKKKRKSKRTKRKRGMSDAGTYLKSIATATQAGSSKMEFPYTLPVIETEVSLDKETHSTIRTAAIAIGSGIAIGGTAVAIGRIIQSKS